MDRRVVITGLSAITPIGRTEDQILENLLAGVSGIRPIRDDELLTGRLHCGVFGTVTDEIEYDFPRRSRKTMGPVSYYACQVAKEAIAQSGLTEEELGSGNIGVAFGSTHGSPTVQRDIYKIFFSGDAKGLRKIGATEYLKSMVHTTAVNITRMFGITGRVISSGTACTTSAQSIGFGYEAIRFGRQDAMICGGADEYDTTTVAVFDNLLACSTKFNDSPSETPRPFDVRRDGLVVGEGAGAVVLEELEHAKRRGAPILAEVIGFACSNNGGDLILPNTDGVRRTLKMGLADAKLAPEEMDLISAHATATPIGDVVESRAIHDVYGEKIPVVGLKGYTGHTMGACGVIETAFVLHMMKRGVVVKTLNLEEVDPRCAAINHVLESVERKIQVASVQNFAFGGVNTCLLYRRFD
ncbi:MAG: beta-ketoacyl synthase N-terminal-like domain-containing protein [bacterium]